MATHNPGADAATKEALQFWGYMFQPDKRGTPMLNRLLEGIANYVSVNFSPIADCPDITPTQLAAFYRAVGGDYDVLFQATTPLAFIYKTLGCLHSLQPAPNSDDYTAPNVPALKRRGFVTWQTIQLLLCPEEHVPFLQLAVQRFDIVDPGTKQVFPKILPKEAFPDKHDEGMERWYNEVTERLRRDMEKVHLEEAAGEGHSHGHAYGPGLRPSQAGERAHGERMPSDFSAEDSAEEHPTAASHFRDPLYPRRDGRPAIVRRYSRVPRSPREFVQDRGRQVKDTIGRHIWLPWVRDKERRKSPTERHGSGTYFEDVEGDDDYSGDEDNHPHPRHAHTGAGSGSGGLPHRPAPGRRRGSSRSYSSDSDTDSGSSPRVSIPHRERPGHEPRFVRRGSHTNHHIPLRHRRSHSPPSSPREYFPPHNDYPYGRRHSQQHAMGSYAAHVPNPAQRERERERHSDPPSRMTDRRERDRDKERESPRESDRERMRERQKHQRADSHRDARLPRDLRDPRSNNDKIPSPRTPPPIKTYSGTNLSALAGGAHKAGFVPSKEPLFATQVAHLQPPPTQLGTGASAPQITRMYYNDGSAAGTPVGVAAGPPAGRRPSYPPRSSYNTAAAAERTALPARASSVRCTRPTGTMSASASPRMGPVALDGERWGLGTGPAVGLGGLGGSRASSRERSAGAGVPLRYASGEGVAGVGGRRYVVDPGVGAGAGVGGGAGRREERY